MCISVCPSVRLCSMCTVPTKSLTWCQIPWNLSYRWFWATMLVLRIEPGSSGRALSTLNCWAVSLALWWFYFLTGQDEGFFILSEPGCSPGYTLYSFDENYRTLRRKASLRGVHSPSLACLLVVLSIWLWDSAASCQAGDIHSPWSWDSFAFQKPRPDSAQAVVRTRQGTIQKSCATRSHFDLPRMAMMGLDVILSSCFHLIWNGSYFSILLFICVHVCLEYERLPMFMSSSITVHIIVWNRVYRLTWSWPVSSRSLPVSTPVLWFQACAAVNSFIRRCWILEFRSSCLTNRHKPWWLLAWKAWEDV